MKKHLLFLFSCLLIFTVAKAQPGFINTIAGGGVGDNSLAINANLQLPFCVATDRAGNVYIDDLVNQRIRKITRSTGIISTIAGNGKAGYDGDDGLATDAELNYPRGVAVDSAGNVYIADAVNSRVRRVDAQSGIITTYAGGGTGGLGDGGKAIECSMSEPWGVALDKHGNLFIADTYNQRVREVNAKTGIINTIAGNGQFGSGGDGDSAIHAQFGYPVGLAVDTAGNVYIVDQDNCKVREVYASNAIINTIAGTGSFSYSGDGGLAIYASIYIPSGVAVDDSNNVYVTGIYESRVRKITAATGIINTIAGNGQFRYTSDGGLADTTSLYFPTGVALDAHRNVFIADFESNRIRQIDTLGIIHTFAGGAGVGDGGSALSAALSYPVNVAVDKSSNVYIADMENNRVRKITTSTGIISTIAGSGISKYNNDGGLADTSSLYLPTGVAFDDSENVYILCSGDARLRKVNALTGKISTVANIYGVQGYSGDNIPDSTAEFYFAPYVVLNLYYYYPLNYGVTLDKQGNIYIADGNNRIRKITSSTGIITTVAGNGTPGVDGDGGQATNAQLNNPTNVAFDDSGNMYIADFGNYRIRKVDASTGNITTVAGGGINVLESGMATSALLYPSAIAIDTFGNMYVTNWYNNLVQVVNLSTGFLNTVTGIGVEGYSGDGGLAKNAEVNYPYGVALDASRNIYIADTYNNVIREINAFSNIGPAGIEQLSDANSISVYPNPANSNVNVAIGTGIISGNGTIRVCDVTGREMIEMNKYINSGSTVAIDISSFSAGVYLVTLNIGQYSSVAKVIKQ